MQKEYRGRRQEGGGEARTTTRLVKNEVTLPNASERTPRSNDAAGGNRCMQVEEGRAVISLASLLLPKSCGDI